MFSFFFFSINIKKPAASQSGLSVCVSVCMCLHKVALLSDARHCFATVFSPCYQGLFLFCFHPAKLPMANFTSVLDCKMSLAIQMPHVFAPQKEPFPPPVIRGDA